MATAHLFIIANAKQLRTDGIFRILLPFFRTFCGVGDLNSVLYNSFHNRAEFGTILVGLRNFWWGGRGGGLSVLQAEACNTDTTPIQLHSNSSTHRTKNNTTNVVIQQNSRKLLMIDILMSETCWAHKKWNKIASEAVLKPATWIPPQPNHTETPTHIEPRTIRLMW